MRTCEALPLPRCPFRERQADSALLAPRYFGESNEPFAALHRRRLTRTAWYYSGTKDCRPDFNPALTSPD